MIRKFIKDGLIYTLPLLLSRGIGFFLIPLYTRILNPSDYGVLDLFVMIGSIINLTIALEVTQGLAFYHAKANQENERTAYASTAFWFTLGAYTLYLVISILFSHQFAQIITGSNTYQFIFQLSTIYIFCNGIFLFLQNQLRWELRSTQFAISNITMTLVTAVTAFVFAYHLGMGLKGILLGMIVGVISGLFTSAFKLNKTIHRLFDLQKLKEMLAYSVPLVPSSVCVFVSIYIDRIMINKMMSLEDVGIYGIGVRFATISALLIAGFRSAITPLILKHHEDETAPRDIVRIFNVFVAFSLLMYLGAALFSRELLAFMTTSVYWSAATLIPILVLSTLVANLYIFTPGIFLVRKTHIVIWINFTIALTNIILNLLLIPILGIMGAAISTLVASFIGFCIYLYFNQKTYYLPLEIKKIILSCGSLFLISSVGLYTHAISLPFFMIKIVCFCGAIALLHIYQLIDIGKLCAPLIKNRKDNSDA